MRNWDEGDALALVKEQTKSSRRSRRSGTSSTLDPAIAAATMEAKVSNKSSDDEGAVIHPDSKELSSSSAEVPIPIRSIESQPAPFGPAATKKLLRRLDLHLLPYLTLIYLLCYLDRTNVGNARLFSMEKELGMKGLDYNIALAILFPFYVAAEIPSNIMLKRIRPSIWFMIIMLAWGLVMTCMGLIHNFSGLLATRVFLGIAEGGLFPGVTYYITMWYCRHEVSFRLALFFSAATAAGAFGGLLARAISEMNGVGGKPAWAWIFILEGLATLIVASFARWAIHDYPSTAKFLSSEERVEVQRRLAEDEGLSDSFGLQYLIQAVRDWKIWVMMITTIGLFTPLYSMSLFLPTIIKAFGYSANKSQLLTVPPYILACILTIGGSYLADKAGQRGVFLLGFQTTAIVGFLMLIASSSHHVQYAGSFLAAGGIFPCVPLIGAWTSNNIGGSTKRAVGIAMQVGFGNLGGVIAGFVYLSRDAPRFIKGHAILIGLISMSFVLTSLMTIYYRRENARRDATLAARNISMAQYTEEMKWQERENADDALFFRYTI